MWLDLLLETCAFMPNMSYQIRKIKSFSPTTPLVTRTWLSSRPYGPMPPLLNVSQPLSLASFEASPSSTHISHITSTIFGSRIFPLP